MNTTPQKNRPWRIVLPLVAGVFLAAIFLLVGSRAAQLHHLALPLSAFAPYDPASYGIPYEIGNYRILAVKTSANTACLSQGRMRITVQAAQFSLESLLTSKRDVVRKTLQQLPSLANTQFDLEYIGLAPWNPEQFMSSNASWNAARKNGCLILGPIPSLMPRFTPTPDPMEHVPDEYTSST